MDRLALLFRGPLPVSSGTTLALFGISHDDPEKSIDPVKLAEAYAAREKLSKTERLQIMWNFNGTSYSPELQEVNTVGLYGLMVGWCYGGVTSGSASLITFKEQNKYTMFQHPREAQKIATQHILFHFARGGLLFGLRYAFFSWSYLAMAHSMSVAYHRVNPVDHMVAGFTVGSLHRLSSGWRPALSAGIVGSGSGLLIGFTFWVAHLLRGGDVGARWVARYAEDERAYQIAYEKELEQKRKKSSARPADTVRSQGLSDIPGEVQSPPQRPRHTLNTDISEKESDFILDRMAARARIFLFGPSPDPNPDFIPDKWTKAPTDYEDFEWKTSKRKSD